MSPQLRAIAELLTARFGLKLDADQRAALERAVTQRVEATGLEAGAYLARLRDERGRGTELDALAQALSVPETWFFRRPDAFELLSRELRRCRQRAAVQLLCLPCSTGEEAWSLAMAGLDAGLTPDQIQVTAMDLSERSLEKARRGGPYSNWAFRTDDLSFRERHMRREDGQWWIRPSLRGRVRFLRANAMDGLPRIPGVGYDIVFCRNLLIYLDPKGRERLSRALVTALAPSGLLFTTSAESHQFRAHLRPAFPGVSYVWGRAPARPRPAPARPPAPLAPPAPLTPTAAPAAVPPAPAGPEPLADARRLADAGELSGALALCQARLAVDGADREALFLMGVVQGAMGATGEARRTLRKVLYLDPDHAEALEQLATLAIRAGDREAGRALMQRARRARGGAA